MFDVGRSMLDVHLLNQHRIATAFKLDSWWLFI